MLSKLFAQQTKCQMCPRHNLLHVQLTFGHARIPEDYQNKDQPGWVGASRWITRSARLFAKGKLGDRRYELIRNILGQPNSNSLLAGH